MTGRFNATMVADETLSGVRTFHEPRGQRACGAPQRHKTTLRGTPQTGRREPKQTWTKAKSSPQEAFRLGPRGKVLVGIRFFTHLAGDFSKGQALSYDARGEFAKAVTVIHILPIVEPEGLLINVAKQVKRFDANVRSAEPALQETPEVLHPVRVDISAHV